MFRHVFIYRLKCLIRDRELVFWTFLFPIILGTFFYMAFMNISNNEAFHPIDAALVPGGEEQFDAPFQAVMEDVSTGKDRLFNLKMASDRAEAEKWLKQGKIAGFYTSGRTIELTVEETGMNQSIMKSFADQYRSANAAVTRIASENPAALKDGLLSDVGDQQNFVRETAGGNAEPDNLLNYFYSLIAMACLYGSFWGMKEVTDIQADISDRAARVNMAPVHKLKAFLAGSSAGLLILYVEILLLIAYLHYVLGIDFGNRTGYVLLTAFVGSILGQSFGAFIGAIVKTGEGLKIALLIVVTMVGSFLSGMMYLNMKYLIAEHVPLLAWINPVNLLTDAFYALYYYDSLHRFTLNLLVMCGFVILFCAGTYLIVRRRKYASL
ncbi:ABC transporter permease [Sporolactobacillus sp. THM7-7]|nr:ABC transporter permease [Sporolactobacillus sp. THM7-7]